MRETVKYSDKYLDKLGKGECPPNMKEIKRYGEYCWQEGCSSREPTLADTAPHFFRNTSDMYRNNIHLMAKEDDILDPWMKKHWFK